MPDERRLNIGLTCYPTVGGSGILTTALGEALARRGHDVHFISYERPFRLSPDAERVRFHAVEVNDYGLFKYPDYTLPLSVKMAEVSRACSLDVLHVHYAVPHATAAILARSMLPPDLRPAVVTTLHGTDITLMGSDGNYGPAITHALASSDAVTAVSAYLRDETHRVLKPDCPIDVVHNFFTPRPPQRSRAQVRNDLGLVDGEAMLLHVSNLRPVKRVDLLLEAVAGVRPRDGFKLVILAGESFGPFEPLVRRMGLEGRVVVREKVNEVEDYLAAADLSLVSSETESFCLAVLEAMSFACPSVATRVGGIPEVIETGRTGTLVPFGDTAAFTSAIEAMLRQPERRRLMGRAAQDDARHVFSAESIVPQYENIYRRVGDRPSGRITKAASSDS